MLGYVFPQISVSEKQTRNTEQEELEGHCGMALPPPVTLKTGNRNLLDLLSTEDEAAAFVSFTSIGLHHTAFFSPSCQAPSNSDSH